MPDAVPRLLRSLLALVLAASTLPAFGAVQRSFVASTGNDANACSVVAPCRSFGAAIAKTLAGGEVIVLDSAGYGIVTITQPVSLIAPQGTYAGISVFAAQTGITVNAPGATVVLRGLSINGVEPGSLDGILFAHGARLRVEACVISNLGSVGIVQGATGSEMAVLDTIIRDNGGRGISLIADATAVLDNDRLEHNGGDGIYVAAVTSRATATIRRSVLSNNAAAGAAAAMPNPPATTHLVIEDSIVANNAGDGIFAGGTLDGGVEALVRRNSISSNAYSGISAFASSLAASVHVHAFDNTFSDNPTSGTKADGYSAVVWISRNDFSYPISSDTVNSALTLTLKDNQGTPFSLGSTTPVSGF